MRKNHPGEGSKAGSLETKVPKLIAATISHKDIAERHKLETKPNGVEASTGVTKGHANNGSRGIAACGESKGILPNNAETYGDSKGATLNRPTCGDDAETSKALCIIP